MKLISVKRQALYTLVKLVIVYVMYLSFLVEHRLLWMGVLAFNVLAYGSDVCNETLCLINRVIIVGSKVS